MSARTTPRDFFAHLGATIALYASAVASIDLGFAIADKAFPDPLAPFSAASIVWPVSLLIVLVPVLYALEWLIARDIARTPEKSAVWIRRWRIYLTLFLTGATIAGDLIALINTYLNGEVTGHFILKVLIVLGVAAIVFAYYLLDRAMKSPLWRGILGWAGLVAVVAAIVAGFVIVGSPGKQRAIRFDQERVSDLMNVQSEVISYWENKGSLPASSTLAVLMQGQSLADLETGAAYVYQPTTDDSFELCADFSLPSSEEQDGSPIYNMPMISAGEASNYDWTHPAGNYCFDRTLSFAAYPVSK